MHLLRRDPFRVLFPVGAALSWAGVGTWLLFVGGLWPGWPGVAHALTMTQAFLAAIALGFLGTLIPRRTGTEPMSGVELSLFAALLSGAVVLLFAGRIAWAEVTHLVVLAGLGRFVLTRLAAARHHEPRRPLPPSFVFVPAGLLGAVIGAALLVVQDRIGGVAYAAGRSLAEEALLEALVLAMAPVLAPVISHGHPMKEPAPGWGPRLGWLAAAAAFLGTFAAQQLVSDRLGLALRGALLAVVLMVGAEAWRPPTREGLHRAVFWLSLLICPAGLLLGAAVPALRLGLLHVTFVGGLSLLVFAVSFHVVFLHTGRDALAAGRPWPVLVVAALTLAAAMVRAGAEQAGHNYFLALGSAAALWLAAAVLWGVYLGAMLLRGR